MTIAPYNDLYLSVQRSGHESAPQDGHLTHGILASEATAFIPEPPPALQDAVSLGDPIEVLLIPPAHHGDAPVERIRVEEVLAFRPSRGEENSLTSLLLTLARPSRYGTMMRPFNGHELRDALIKSGDQMWGALEDTRIVRPGLRGDLPDWIWENLPEREQQQRRDRVRLRTYRDPGGNVCSFCSFIKWPCDPGDPGGFRGLGHQPGGNDR